ncbi:MAG: polyprenyl synthetase family protein [Geobacteraceae bacterium]|jgi:octaprenyl-diphosphate synthase
MEAVLALIGEDLKNVELQFKKDLYSDVPLIQKVGEYVISSGGKRIRPMLLILSAYLCGYRGSRHVQIASVIEFIHTATLLHDDVVDNANLRRGLASANTLWGNEASVLVGDFLYCKSFALMVADGDLNILKLLAKATTVLAEGEVLQLIYTRNTDITGEQYIEVVKCKTAILLSAACQAGAILGATSAGHEAAMREFGMELGIAFQMVDDSLDYSASEEQFGKSIGHDLEEGKITLPLIHTMKKCTYKERRQIADIVKKELIDKDDFKTVFALVGKYGGIDHTLEMARQYSERSKKCLDIFEDSPYKAALLELADFIVTRAK